MSTDRVGNIHAPLSPIAIQAGQLVVYTSSRTEILLGIADPVPSCEGKNELELVSD